MVPYLISVNRERFLILTMTTKEKVCEAIKNEIVSHLDNVGLYRTLRGGFHLTFKIEGPLDIVGVLDLNDIDPDDVEAGEYVVYFDK